MRSPFSFLLLIDFLFQALSFVPKSPFCRPRYSAQPSAFTRIKASADKINKEELATNLVNSAEKWLSKQTLNTIYPYERVQTLVYSIKLNESRTSMEPTFDLLWKDIEQFIATENRPLKAILGNQLTTKVLSAVESTDIYEPSAVRSFLQAPVFEKMIGGILYEGIFEFLQRVDIIGNVVNKLPLIGPIRQTFIKEFKKVIDSILGEQLKSFLASYNRIAVQRIVDFLLSKDNRGYLAQANKNLVSTLLSRPISELLPNQATRDQLKVSLWAAVNAVSEEDILNIVKTVYDNYSDRSFSPLTSSIASVPALKGAAADVLLQFINSPEGQESLFRESS